MPSQITHQLFVEDVLSAFLQKRGRELYDNYSTLINFAAQGPDIFYHNRRTEPSSNMYGKRVHSKNYGKLVRTMSEHALKAGEHEHTLLAAYIMGFSTHAVLDRYAHPFIIYYAGWVEPFSIDSQKYHRAHPFFERIIDVLMLWYRREKKITEYDFSRVFDIGKLPEAITGIIVDSLRETYPGVKKRKITPESLESAVKDTLFFYNMTNPIHPENRVEAYKREQDNISSPRVLALFHPHHIPDDYDFLNIERKEWIDPCDPSVTSTDSFLDIYNRAVEEAARVVTAIDNVFLRRENSEQIEALLGNGNLSDGRNLGACKPRRADPLPLADILDDIYQTIEQELSTSS